VEEMDGFKNFQKVVSNRITRIVGRFSRRRQDTLNCHGIKDCGEAKRGLMEGRTLYALVSRRGRRTK